MKFTVQKEDLKAALPALMEIASRNKVGPCSDRILMNANNNQLKLTSTDLDTTVVIDVGAMVEEKGGLVVPAKALHGLVSVAQGDLEFSFGGSGQAKVKTGTKGSAKLNVLDLESYPDVEYSRKKATQVIKTKVKEFAKAIESVAVAASTDDFRANLCGVFVDAARALCVATDGHRLHIGSLGGEITGEDLFLPIGGVKAFLKAAKDHDGELTISTDGNTIFFDFESMSLSTRASNATFPNYRVLVNGSEEIKARKSEMEIALKYVLAMCENKKEGVKLHVKNDTITLITQDDHNGETTCVASCDSTHDVLCTVCAAYLLDAIKHLDDEEITIRQIGEESAMIFEDAQKTAIVMPMKG